MASEEFLGMGEANDFMNLPIETWLIAASNIAEIFDDCAKQSNGEVETERLVNYLEELSTRQNWIGLHLLAEEIRKNEGETMDKATFVDKYLTWKDNTESRLLELKSTEKTRLSSQRQGQRLMSIPVTSQVTLPEEEEEEDEEPNNNRANEPLYKTDDTPFRDETKKQLLKIDLLMSENERLKRTIEIQEEQQQQAEQLLNQQKKKNAEIEKSHLHQCIMNESLEKGKDELMKMTTLMKSKIEMLETKIQKGDKEKTRKEDDKMALELRNNALEAENVDLLKKVKALNEAQTRMTTVNLEHKLKLIQSEAEKNELRLEIDNCRESNKILNSMLEDLQNENKCEQPTPSIGAPLPCQDHLNFSDDGGSFLSQTNRKPLFFSTPDLRVKVTPSVTIDAPSTDYKPSIENEFQQLGHETLSVGPFLGKPSLALDATSPNNSQLFPNAQLVFLDESQPSHSTPKKTESDNIGSEDDTKLLCAEASTQTMEEDIPRTEDEGKRMQPKHGQDMEDQPTTNRWLRWMKKTWALIRWGGSWRLLLGFSTLFMLLFLSLLAYHLLAIATLPPLYRHDPLHNFLNSFLEERSGPGPVPL